MELTEGFPGGGAARCACPAYKTRVRHQARSADKAFTP
ncbi:hypothetical protein GRPL_04881 [Raoultella planticola ATCC 33531]|nr:hypothetical protein GRPL_04881 [Raoultella planticola ATCC 33531]